MKLKAERLACTLLLLLAPFLAGAQTTIQSNLQAAAQSTAFTYQGALSDSSRPANGAYDLTFALYDDPTNSNQLGIVLTNLAVPVSNGLFSVALDFGAVFDGGSRWLEIGVRTNFTTDAFNTNDFTRLAPRQAITPAPYAMFANNAANAANAGLASNLVAGATLDNFSMSGSNILPGTITAAQIDPATDAAYRASGINALVSITEFTNSSTIYVDSTYGYDVGVRGMPSRPWKNPTNAFEAIQDGDTVVLRGSWVLPAGLVTYGPENQGGLFISGKSNVTVMGYGATIQFVGPGNGLCVSNVTNFKLFGLTLAGDRTPYSVLTGALVFNATNNFVEIAHCTIRDCFDQGITTVGTGTYNTENLWIHENYFYNIGTTNMADRADIPSGVDGSCISGFDGGNQWVCNNRADNVVRFWEFENAGNPFDSRVCENVNLLNNTVTRCKDWGFLAVRHILNNVLIAGNRVSRDPNSPSPFFLNSVYLECPGTNFIIRDNFFDGSGISVTASEYGDTGNVFIDNNIISSPEGIWIQSGGESTQYSVKHVIIRNNCLRGCASPLVVGSEDTDIIGNLFESFGTQDWGVCVTAVTEDLGWVTGNASNLVIRQNRISSTGSGNYLTAFYVRNLTGVVPNKVTWDDNEFPTNVALACEPYAKAGTFLLRHEAAGSPVGLVAASPGSTWRDTAAGQMYLKKCGEDETGWASIQATDSDSDPANVSQVATVPKALTAFATVGSGNASVSPPADTTTVKAWLNITNGSQVFKLPLYQ